MVPDDDLRAAQVVFGDRLADAHRYVDLLATSGIERGLIGPREVPRLWSRHVLNCAVVAELIAGDSTVIDIGSGAGLPGIPIALARPDLVVTLVEPLDRRCRWLHEVIDDLGLPVTVVRARAQEAVGVLDPADVVTARAVAPLAKLARLALPLCRPDGIVLALKGRSVQDEIAAGAGTLRSERVTATILTAGQDLLTDPTTVVRLCRDAGPHGVP